MTDGQSVLGLRRSCEPEGAGTGEDITDRQLLERFVAAREEAAFAALVRRHGPRVLAVCRRVLRDEHHAEDVFQATFLVLAQKAAAVRWQESLHPWLQAVAYRLALHARAAARRRRERPVGAVWPNSPCSDGGESEPADEWERLLERAHPCGDLLAEVARRELRRVLTDELRQLPEKYRAPVVLCYLQGKTNEEAAKELGWPSGSMSRRLARARALLRERLTRRGLAFSIAFVLVLAILWVVRGGFRSAPSSPDVTVAEAMRSFQSDAGSGPGIEGFLLRLAEDGTLPAGAGREQLTRMAHHAAGVAERIDNHDPGRRRQDWRRFSGEMRSAALDLANALQTQDDRATLRSARRLHASCQKCHEVFRD
jgi:RNA polymerase sigma-70 factor (ECF subfamily)